MPNPQKVKFIPTGPDITRFQEFQFDENLGEAPLLQKASRQDRDLGGPKDWKQVTKGFLKICREKLLKD